MGQYIFGLSILIGLKKDKKKKEKKETHVEKKRERGKVYSLRPPQSPKNYHLRTINLNSL